MEQHSATSPHIVVLPFQAEGHIKPMLNLAKLLSHRGQRVTFVNSHQVHNRLLQFTDLPSFHTQFPGFHFASINDGLPSDHLPNMPLIDKDNILILMSSSARSLAAKEFRELFLRLLQKNEQWQPPSCIIADGIMTTIAIGVAQEFGVPLIAFRTYSATCTWATIHLSRLDQEGRLLSNNQENVENAPANIPGLENLLRNCDLPSYFRIALTDVSVFKNFYVEETLAMTQASALILNTFEQLEPSIITKLATIFPKVYSIGPLHTLCKTILMPNSSSPHKDGRLRKEDGSCMTWLDRQKEKSVLYVSFGTVVRLSQEELLEIWHGLVNSLKPFLWVVQKDLIQKNVPVERGLLVDWAPQEEVLSHPAVCGFWTHSGWNSTLESIAEGVPMLCCPCVADQPVNSRCVSEQWRIGLDMNKWRIGLDMNSMSIRLIGLDMNSMSIRLIVEKMVRDFMENEKKELMRSVTDIAKNAQDSTRENGSSYQNLENLIKDISLMKVLD